MDGLSLADWRAQRIETKVLPSGLTMKLRRVSIMDLAAQGNLPPALLQMVEEAQQKGEKMAFQIQDFEKFGGSVNAFVLACAVDPPVVEGSGTDEALGINELPFEDKQFIFSWANEGSEALKKFRQQPGQPDHPG